LQISILNLTDDDNPIGEISRIEAQLEELAEVSERCRKTVAGGVALPLFMMLGLFGSNQVAAIGSIAVVLGGIVSLSTRPTRVTEGTGWTPPGGIALPTLSA